LAKLYIGCKKNCLIGWEKKQQFSEFSPISVNKRAVSCNQSKTKRETRERKRNFGNSNVTDNQSLRIYLYTIKFPIVCRYTFIGFGSQIVVHFFFSARDSPLKKEEKATRYQVGTFLFDEDREEKRKKKNVNRAQALIKYL
jgi:hypothetical protein